MADNPSNASTSATVSYIGNASTNTADSQVADYLTTIAKDLESRQPTNYRPQTEDSSLAVLNRSIFEANKRYKILPNFKLGIVVEVIKNVDTTVFPDGFCFTKPVTAYRIVPLEMLSGFDSKDEEKTIELLRDFTRVFYPPRDDFEKVFDVFDICEITYPETFPNNENALDNRYINKISGVAAGNTTIPADSNKDGPSQEDVLKQVQALNSKTPKTEPAPKGGEDYTGVADFFDAFDKSVLDKIPPDKLAGPPFKKPVWMTSPPTTERLDPAPKPGTVAKITAHGGVDLAGLRAPPPILYSAADGKIFKVTADEKSGLIVFIQHEQYASKYVHLSSFIFKNAEGKYEATLDPSKLLNKTVKEGDPIGLQGSTGHSNGPHLHFEIWVGTKFSELKKTNPLIFMKPYAYSAGESVKKKFNLRGNTINVPIKPDKIPPAKTTNSNLADAKAPVPKEKDGSAPPKSGKKTTGSMPKRKPKMSMLNFRCDFSKNVKRTNQHGTEFILVREDVYHKLTEIKAILNNYGIVFSTQSKPININLKESNVLEITGLQIQLNKFCALNPDGNPETDDYVIKHTENVFQPLEIYANLKSLDVLQNVYKNFDPLEYIFRGEMNVYDIRNTYKLKSKPKTVKLYGNFFNITKLFKNFGFFQSSPAQLFYSSSNYEESFWWKFTDLSTIKRDVSTVESVLSTVYYNKGEAIWNDSYKTWDGLRFK